VAVRALVEAGRRSTHVVIHSDNQGVVHSIRAGHSRGGQQNAILRQIVSLMQEHQLWISTEWISTHKNPADAISRGVFPANGKRIPNRPALPAHLRPLLVPV
jgi:hypothetical protein